MKRIWLGSRRIRLRDAQNYPSPVCDLCGAVTEGLPVEGITLGYRSAAYVLDGRAWVCASPDCMDAWSDALEADDADRAARRGAVDSAPTETESAPMTDTRISDIKHDLLSFAGAATRRTLENVWTEGGSVYGVARSVVTRTAWGAVCGAAGAGLGAMTGFLIGPPGPRGEMDPKERLVRQVKYSQMVRDAAPMIVSALSTIEYEARKKLEEMGHYPCEECGIPHVKAQRHQMPPGTYWDVERNCYLRPDNADWKQAAYEAAAEDDRWELEDDEDDDSEEQVH